LVLSSAVELLSKIVLQPLEMLLHQIHKMAATIFQSVTDMAVTMDEEDEVADDTSEDHEDGKGGGFEDETALLEKVVQKLSLLSENSSKSQGNSAQMQGLEEGDRAVIHGFQGSSDMKDAAWANASMDELVAIEEMKIQNEQIAVQQQGALENAGLSVDLLNSWNLNPLELDKARNHAAVLFFLGQHNHGTEFDPTLMDSFLEEVEAGYNRTCPYHTWFHAVDVTHCVYRILEVSYADMYMTRSERFALLVSAVAHDVGHPGLNNKFLVQTSNAIAITYNDKSPLENMHCSRLFTLAEKPGCKIFNRLTKQTYQEIRKICIDAILHTDTAFHFKMIKEVQMIYEMNSEIFDSCLIEDWPSEDALVCFRAPESRKLLVKLFLHVADLSNPMKPFRICRLWAYQVQEEFFFAGR